MIWRRARWAFTAACLMLGGCGNAYEHISVGEWQEAGKPQPPESRSQGSYLVTTVTQGSGPTVAAGDLVKATVQPLIDPLNPGATPAGNQPPAQTVWVWTGHEPRAEDSHEWAVELDTFGYLGAARVRAAFIGRRLHEQFEIHLEPGSKDFGDQLPLRGVSEQPFAGLKGGWNEIGGRPVSRLRWPALPLVVSGPNKPAAQIEILAICKARLLRRTATLSQFGIVFATGDTRYASARKGTLGWTVIEAQCPAPDGQFRIQAGPFHHTGDSPDGTWLADWSSSYVRLRPAAQHPEEWEVARELVWETINRRMAPIRKQISDLEGARRHAQLECQISRKCETAVQSQQRQQQRDSLLAKAVQQEKALECELEKKCE